MPLVLELRLDEKFVVLRHGGVAVRERDLGTYDWTADRKMNPG